MTAMEPTWNPTPVRIHTGSEMSNNEPLSTPYITTTSSVKEGGVVIHTELLPFQTTSSMHCYQG